ATGLINVAN
ncbi:hypothetical protein MK527_11465, partial [Streptococcus gallolyticus subsp. gallolyticus]|nr:hypothetical protein [Streptococcus gallolyticus subsp. gallolyticus]